MIKARGDGFFVYKGPGFPGANISGGSGSGAGADAAIRRFHEAGFGSKNVFKALKTF